jgi:hypothetical protein
MQPAFCALATNACTDARGISLVKIIRFHARAISSADGSLRISASQSVSSRCARQNLFALGKQRDCPGSCR